MKVKINSEIGPLEQVLVHRPAAEIERMTQHELDRLLFDDILSPADASDEHDLMVEIIRAAGAQVFHVVPLLTRALEESAPKVRRALIDDVCTRAGASELADALEAWSPAHLAEGLTAGVLWRELEDAPTSLARLRARRYDPSDFALRPQPNLMFLRDPAVAMFDRIVTSRMATEARSREPALVSYAIRWGVEASYGGFLDVDDLDVAAHFRTLEGGDVLVVAPEFILIGCSERTRAQAVERLVHDMLFEAFPALERVYAVLMPEARTIMHLDTVLTQLDQRLFLGHRPLIEGGSDQALSVVRLERRKEPVLIEGASVLDVLRDELDDGGRRVQLVPCGGDNPIRQEREQWTDGANAFCLAPGKALLYSRNVATVRALEEEGFESVLLNVAQPADLRSSLLDQGMAAERTVFCFSGSELSRARGGGRCLTLPLSRREVPA